MTTKGVAHRRHATTYSVDVRCIICGAPELVAGHHVCERHHAFRGRCGRCGYVRPENVGTKLERPGPAPREAATRRKGS